ncbi:MAG TPA: hypothetical protein VE988_15365 [Gemmataceae bacterium]|nr:hypothetical protein [Gemmataceae bacterium]
MRKKFIASMVCLIVAISAMTTAQGQDKKQDKISEGAKKVMVLKLKHSQTLLEGLALADFKKIASNAEELIQLTNKEEWQVIKTVKYELFSNEFRRSVEAILQKAKDKNIDGATLAYMDMTMSCVRCHVYVREVRGARGPAPATDWIAASIDINGRVLP